MLRYWGMDSGVRHDCHIDTLFVKSALTEDANKLII